MAKNPSLHVGIGASAGGIEACGALLNAVPANSDVAFIVVMHLDPTRASRIAEILQAKTDNVTVSQAEGTVRLEPDHAYVIAPNSKLSLSDGILEVSPLAENEARGKLVDYLFTSLAAAQGAQAVGIVLSGAGHDGAEGLEAIKRAGGLCLAQDPETASSESMPRSAMQIGVDAVLAPEKIPAAILAFAKNGSRPTVPIAETAAGEIDETLAPSFRRILKQLGALADVSFDDYKIGTLKRRTVRRMSLLGVTGWDDYANLLETDSEELHALYDDVLIGVTEFYRDAEVWDQLVAELHSVFAQRDPPEARVWVAGCGSGEEAYTLAILLHNVIKDLERGKIQLFATDLNERSIAKARRGIYPLESIAGLPQKWRDQYFTENDGHAKIRGRIRDLVTFATHNVLSDPPFSQMDIVSCRNLLIYLKPQAHDRVLKRLHFALREGGLLVLGSAETVARQGRLFEEISKSLGIFRARAARGNERLQIQARPTRRRTRMSAATAESLPASTVVTRGPDRRIEQFVLRERTPACVAIDENLEIQHFYGVTERYLVPPSGESRQDLLAWIRPGFYIQLRAVLKQVIDTGKVLAAEGHIDYYGEARRVQCTVEPLAASIGMQNLYLVTFNDIGESALKNISEEEAQEPIVRELELELTDTRRELQHTIEQLDSAAEDHDARNEDLQSLNEELQSSNEELEASKEELEALNEEIVTINRELEQKNHELAETNVDLNTLFTSTGIPTVYLNSALQVRRFTAAASAVMRLEPSDLGRSINNIKERFSGGQTVAICRQVLETGELHRSEIVTDDEFTYSRQIVPYAGDDANIGAGVCITFFDTTIQKRMLRASDAAFEYAKAIVETVRTPVIVLDGHLQIHSTNASFRSLISSDDGFVGSILSDSLSPGWNTMPLDQVLKTLITSGEPVNDFEIKNQDRTILVNARRIDSETPLDQRLVLSFEEVTKQRRVQQLQRERTDELTSDARRKDEWIAMLGHELRNPIGAIGSGVALLKSESLDAGRRNRTVQMMDRQLLQVAELLDGLLDAARIISGKLELKRELVDLTEIAQSTIDTVKGQIDAKSHSLTVNLPPSKTVWVNGDRSRLIQVVANLLVNAIKYTEPGGQIRFDVSAEAETATIQVRDSGIGILAGLKDIMFEIFTQGPRALDRSDQGLGLGLPLVRTLVELHNGDVDVFSAGENKGSTFTVRLPRVSALAAVDETPRSGNGLRPAAAVRSRRILITDDQRDAAEALGHLLDFKGHQVKIATSGVDALCIARQFKPEVALLDIGMPDMDGYELAVCLRQECPDTLLIAVTGYQKDAHHLDKAGFNHYLIKPVQTDRLYELLADEIEVH